MVIEKCPKCHSSDIEIKYEQVRQTRLDNPFRDLIRTAYTCYCNRCQKITEMRYTDKNQPVTDNKAYLW